MKKFLTAILVSLTMFSISSVAAPPVSASWRRDEVRYQTLQHKRWTQREVVRTVRAAVHRWHVPGGVRKALAVARCESGLNERAWNGSCCAGVFQQHTSYWRSRQNAYDSHRWKLGESVYNARANIIVSVRMAHGHGWGGWSCA